MIKNKIKSIITTGVVMIMSCSAFADGWGEFRTNWSENCPSGKKWIAHAEVKCNFLQGWIGGSTEVSQPYCAVKEAKIADRAYQKTEYGQGCGFTSTGYTKKKRCYRGCSSFDIINYFGCQMTTEDSSEGPDASESSFIRVSNVAINNTTHSIVLSGISGYERINTVDFYGTFKIVVWLTDNDNDSTITASKTLWTAEAKLENGVITYSNFTNGEVSLNTTDSGYVMMLNNFNKTIQLANTVNMDRIAVRIISHAEETLASSLPSLLSNKSIIATDSEGSLFINPTIVENDINVEFKFSSPVDYSNSTIVIFNEVGKEIYRSSNKIAVFENKFKITDLQLSSGSYYFVFRTNNNKNYVKKFIKL
jgi:hypothetical protein